jgi:hypothetical protein
MNSGCAAMFGPVGDGNGEGAVDDAGDAWAGDGDTLGEGDAAGDGDEASVAVSAMIARSGTYPSIRAGGTRHI